MNVRERSRTQRKYPRGMVLGSDSEPPTFLITKLAQLEEPSSELPFSLP